MNPDAVHRVANSIASPTMLFDYPPLKICKTSF